MNIGNMLKLETEFNYKVNSKISLGLGIDFPLVVKWKNDNIFFKYDYGSDSQIIAYNKFSIGSLITINYNFNK